MTYSSVYQFFKMYFALSLFIISCHGKSAVGLVTLSSMMVAPVCRVGDQLQLTCTAASVEFVEWSFWLFNEHGMEEEITAIRNSRDPNPPPKERIINSTTFTFTRTSVQGESPLVSTLSINSVSISLNGTIVNCMDANNLMVSASTTIQIIDTRLIDTSNNLNISTMIEEYGADNVTVSVNWAQQVGVTYTARISPLAHTLSTWSNSRQLKLSYNTAYNLSVVAVTPCEYATAFIILNYASCGTPETHDSVNYSNYNSIVEGSTVSFRCTDMPFQEKEFTTMCLKNASWIPDPVLQCSSTATRRPVSEALSQDGKIAVASSVTVFIVTSILFFIIGCLCGLFCRRERKTTENKVAKKQIPYYDDVVLKQHEQELELKENIAYGPVPATGYTSSNNN